MTEEYFDSLLHKFKTSEHICYVPKTKLKLDTFPMTTFKSIVEGEYGPLTTTHYETIVSKDNCIVEIIFNVKVNIY